MLAATMSPRSLCLALIAALATLTPLAQATPPDQTWISGFYDNADFDDVVQLVTSAVGTVESGMVSSLRPVSAVISLAVQPDSQIARLLPLPSSPSRAPPAA
jgi:hypothetical protein